MFVTVIESCNHLIAWFCENASFDLKRDFGSLVIITDDEEVAKASLKEALRELIKGDIIAKAKIKDREVWILKKDLGAYEQTVKIEGAASLAIAKIVNKACEITDSAEEYCNPISIVPSDINNLIFICTKLLDSVGEKKLLDGDPNE
jgi:hypothetical protein